MNNAEAYLETCQTFKIENFSKIVNCFLPLTIFAIFSTLHIRPGSEYTSAIAIVTFQYEKKKLSKKDSMRYICYFFLVKFCSRFHYRLILKRFFQYFRFCSVNF